MVGEKSCIVLILFLFPENLGGGMILLLFLTDPGENEQRAGVGQSQSLLHLSESMLSALKTVGSGHSDVTLV